MRPRRDERGSALVELTWLGILLLVPMLWIVLSVFEVQRGRSGSAPPPAPPAGRTRWRPTDAEGRHGPAAAARQALADQGVERRAARRRRHLHAVPAPTATAGTSVITVVVRSRVDLPLMPSASAASAELRASTRRHTVPIGQFQEAGA